MNITILSNIYRLIILLSLFFLFSQADCSRKNDLPVVYHSQEFKDYAVFKEGTFWIYQNELGYIDTFNIIHYETKFIEEDGINKEYISMTRYSSFSEKEINLVTFLDDNSTYQFSEECLYINYLKDYFHNTYFLCCCRIGYNIGYLTYINYIDSIQIKDKQYFKIKVFENIKYNSDTIVNLQYYYAKNIGMIKHTDINNHTWELIDYQINQ